MSLDMFFVKDRPLPVKTRGITPELQELFDTAYEDRAVRSAPSSEDVDAILAVLHRLATKDGTVSLRVRKEGDYTYFQLRDRISRPRKPGAAKPGPKAKKDKVAA